MFSCEESLEVDDEWQEFILNGKLSSDNDLESVNLSNQLNEIPKCSDIYISTKTKIVYLNTEIDLDKIFWKLPIIEYHTPQEGIVKKQMKFNFLNKEELNKFEILSKDIKDLDVQVISKIDNPEGRIKFKDIRKVSIGICQKDIISFRTKKRSAFYNCFVIILRIFDDTKYKEVHVKVFNTGKLEIPGIREDKLLFKTLDYLIDLFGKMGIKNLSFDKNKCETVLINSNFNCGYFLNRDKLLDILIKKYKIECVFDACQYPGIQCKYNYIDETSEDKKEYRLSFMVFRTGSILIVGRCGEDILFKIYDILKNILETEYLNIYCNSYENQKSLIKEKKVKKKTILISD